MISATSTIAVVGASGAVGREALSVLATRGYAPGRIKALASARSAGSRVPFGGGELVIGEVGPGSFDGVSVALFCATSEVAKRLAPAALNAGCHVVDNSSAFRADPAVPLVVPEINGGLAGGAGRGTKLIANPNCSTIIMLLALEPLRKPFGVESIVVSTYQAVSGAGAAAMDELREQAGVVLAGGAAAPRVFREQCAFNVFSHNSTVDVETGLNGEEAKMISESRKIWADPSLRVSPTCVRVPVFRAHTQAISVTLKSAASLQDVRRAYNGAPGIRVIDDRGRNDFPTPLKATGQHDVLVGRLRADPADAGDGTGKHRSFYVLVSGDQLLKGAALNAIQIADLLFAGSGPASNTP